MTNYDFLYDKSYYGEVLYEDCFADKKLGYKEIRHGTILPFKRVKAGTGLGGVYWMGMDVILKVRRFIQDLACHMKRM